jgi:GLPGLI family protein
LIRQIKPGNIMKTYVALILSLGFLSSTNRVAKAQTSGQTWSGQITYEVVRKVDPSSMRIMINGEQVKPGDPNFPTDIPDTRTFGQKVLVAGNYAKENRDERNGAVRTMIGPGGSSTETTNLGRPFDEQVFVDLGAQKVVTLLTVGKEKDTKTYRADASIQRVTGWQLTNQTKKIAGYTCRKATATYRNEPYAVWFTTELPVTYSPLHELTPEAGAVLLIEGSREQFKATKVNVDAPSAKDMQPTTQAQVVTAAQLADLRQKAMADFQQQMMSGERN